MSEAINETNKRIQYTRNDQASSLTIKRSLFNLLATKFGSEKDATRFCREKAAEAIDSGIPSGRISHYVFDKSLEEIMDKKFQS